VPLVVTNQDFYQVIWDTLERSNHILKWTATQAKKASTPPTKRAKASSARYTCSRTNHKCSLECVVVVWWLHQL
jgi:hypothetical protein